ncbi:MAG: tetratricopeptide repeat protein [Candidatus Spechtbacterales bacterium]
MAKQLNLNWDSVGRICIYLLFGLVPMFFLPLTAYPVAENKAILAGALVFVALCAFLAQTLNSGKFSLPKTRFWFALAAFFVIAGISTFLSASPQISFWGDGTSPDSFFSFLTYGFALFLVPFFLRETQHLIRALLFFSVSLFITSLYSLLQFFGIFIIPLDFTRQIFFNPIGTVQALAIFLGSGLAMVLALLTSFKLSTGIKAAFYFGGALLALILILVNFSYVWLGILLASALVAAWQIMHGHRSPSAGGVMLGSKFSITLIVMVVVAILFFTKPPISSVVRFPAEVRPSLQATFDIAQGTLSSGVGKTLFGSGPATFLYEYLRYRSRDLNATAFWGVRFAQGFATVPTLFVTIGVFGTVALVFMFGFFIWVGFRGVAALSRKKPVSPAGGPGFPAGGSLERISFICFVSFLFLIFSWFFYPVSFSILLFTFLFAGMVLASLRAGGAIETWEVSLLKTSQRTFVASLIIIVLIVSSIVGLYLVGQKYIASVVHIFGVQTYNRNRDLDSAIKKVDLAKNLDGSSDVYWRTFAQLLGLRAQEVLNNRDLDSGELQRRYQIVLQNLIRAGQEATMVNPQDPINWRQLGAIYENNIRIVGGADQFAIANYIKAAELNPNNPAEYLNVGRAYVVSADALAVNISRLSQGVEAKKNKEEVEKLQTGRTERLTNALINLQKALALKGDYAPAHFLISQVYERQGNRALAIEKTLETRNFDPLDTGVGYQLGLLYYLDDQLEEARDEFVRVVSLNESFSNARYFLGLSYDRLGNTQGAIDQFTKIAELNPDNAEVKRILVNLKAGKNALLNIIPPPEERITSPLKVTGGEDAEALEAE